MCRTDKPITRGAANLALAAWLLVTLLVTPLAAAQVEPCGEALPLPLDHSIAGDAASWAATRYAVRAETAGFLVVEAHADGPQAAAPDLHFLGRDCQAEDPNLPLAPTRGRVVHRVVEPGTYYLEVAGEADAPVRFRLYAWLTRPGGAALRHDGAPDLEPMDESDELGAPDCPLGAPYCEFEPMDESDELGAPDCPLGAPYCEFEPMDESDELRTDGRTAASWHEIPGHGLLELQRAAGGLGVRVHPLCAWVERPELLATFTCRPFVAHTF